MYLVDFGAVQAAAVEQGTITVVGTYGYMPPEQFGGRAVAASDLYSLGATLIYLASDFISINFFSNSQFSEYLRIFSLAIIPFSLVQYNAEVLRGLGFAPSQMFFKSTGIPLIGIIFLGGMLLANLETSIFVLYLIIISTLCLVSFFLVLVSLRRSFKGSIKLKKISQPKLDRILNLSIPMFLFSSTLSISEWTNTLILGWLGSAEDVGIYTILVRISSLNVLVLIAISTVVAPKLSQKFAQNDFLGLKEEVQKSTKLIFWGSLPIQVLLFIFGGLILSIFGESFEKGLLPLYILLISQFINSTMGIVTVLLNMTDGQIFLRNASIARVLVTVSLNIILIPHIGLYGVAISVLAGILTINILCIRRAYKKLSFFPVYFPILFSKAVYKKNL